MIAVIFELRPGLGQDPRYLDLAAGLRDALAATDGFISVERFHSLPAPVDWPFALGMLYLLDVVLVAYRTAWWPTAAASAGAVLALNFLFVPPRWTLAVAHPEHLISVGALLVVAVLSHADRRGQRRGRQRLGPGQGGQVRAPTAARR